VSYRSLTPTECRGAAANLPALISASARGCRSANSSVGDEQSSLANTLHSLQIHLVRSVKRRARTDEGASSVTEERQSSRLDGACGDLAGCGFETLRPGWHSSEGRMKSEAARCREERRFADGLVIVERVLTLRSIMSSSHPEIPGDQFERGLTCSRVKRRGAGCASPL